MFTCSADQMLKMEENQANGKEYQRANSQRQREDSTKNEMEGGRAPRMKKSWQA